MLVAFSAAATHEAPAFGAFCLERDPIRSTLYLRAYTRVPQVVCRDLESMCLCWFFTRCSLSCDALPDLRRPRVRRCTAHGTGGLISFSGGPTEAFQTCFALAIQVVLTYKAGDTMKSFSIREDLTGIRFRGCALTAWL